MPQNNKVIIIGAGGHGKVVADAIIRQNKYSIAGFADDNRPNGDIVYRDLQVICKADHDSIIACCNSFVIAVGDNSVREKIYKSLLPYLEPVTIIHPSVQFAEDVEIGRGNVLLAGAVINPSVIIGDNCIINSQSLVDHDCILESHVHIGQAAIVGSGNRIAAGTWIRQGENIRSAYY